MASFLRHSGSSEDKTMPHKGPVKNTLSHSTHTTADPEFPEGGLAAFCTVFGGFLAQVCGYGIINSFGVYQSFYAQHYLQNESSSAVSWIGSLASCLGAIVGPVCGKLFDNGYFYHAYIAGAILQSFSIFMLSLVQPGQYYQVLLSQGLAYGIGLGLMYVPSLAIVSHHFKRRQAAMMSIVASGAALGGVIHTIMLNKLLNGPVGFKMGVRISATLLTVLLFLSCILSRTRYDAMCQEVTSVNFWRTTKKCFTEIPSLFTIIGLTLLQVAYLYPVFYFQLDSLRHGLNPSFAFYSSVMINASSFVGRFASGAVLRLVSVVDLAIITAIGCAILVIGMIWLGSVTSVIILGVLFGLFSGMSIAMMAPMMALTSDPVELGVRMGVGFSIISIGNLVGTPICGALLTRRYLWWAPALFTAALALIAGALFIGVRILLDRARASEIERSCSGAEVAGVESGSEKKAVVGT